MVSTDPNTSDLGRRLGPVEVPETTQTAALTVPTVSQTPAEQNAPTEHAPTTEPVAPPKPTFWTYEQGQQAKTLEPSFDAKVKALLQAAHGQLWIGSGFRDTAKQTALHNEAVQKHGADANNWVAPPGHSNHERGEAADIFGNQELLHQLAPQFGLSFPMSWESWHVEPVGLRKDSHPNAYTNGGPTAINPVHDTALDSSPQEVAATIASTFHGATLGGGLETSPGASLAAATTGGIMGTMQPTLGQYGVPAVTGTRASSSGEANTYTTGASVNTDTGNVAAQPASENQQAFIDQIKPYAEAESKRTGIPAEVFIVQSGVETGWGTSGWWTNNRNPAGIGVTGQAGKGFTYPDLASAFKDYADKLMGHGEAGQEQFIADVQAGADAATLLADIERSPWAAGHYGGNGLGQTYQALAQGGAFSAPTPQGEEAGPAPAKPAAQPANQRRNRAR